MESIQLLAVILTVRSGRQKEAAHSWLLTVGSVQEAQVVSLSAEVLRFLGRAVSGVLEAGCLLPASNPATWVLLTGCEFISSCPLSPFTALERAHHTPTLGHPPLYLDVLLASNILSQSMSSHFPGP